MIIRSTFQARYPSRILGCLALGITEIGRHRDDCIRNGLAEILLCVFF